MKQLKRREGNKLVQGKECREEVMEMDSKPGHTLQECCTEPNHHPGYLHIKFSGMGWVMNDGAKTMTATRERKGRCPWV